jgi:hypothetical protein
LPWPLSQDYNEAIQDPLHAFADPDLGGGHAVVNALGLPLPRSGNFADVYEFRGAGGGRWAVKCFTRQVHGLRERYAAISRHLARAKLPFMVDFQYQEQGVRVRGAWYPVVKMRWVEGLLLNQFARDHLEKPAVLDSLADIWLKMGRRLRQASVAHADLQHGNVILVPGSRASALAVKLIDYDGMWVPALARTPSGELGHPAYQHPKRLAQGVYSAEVDRLPLLAVACALRAVAVGGKPLWERYDNGDNLLFRREDLADPGRSPLFRDLWRLPDAALHDLVGYLALGVTGPLAETPLAYEVMAEGLTRPLSASEERRVAGLLGSAPTAVRAVPVGATPVPAALAAPADRQAGPWGQRETAGFADAAEPERVVGVSPIIAPHRRVRSVRRAVWLVAVTAAVSAAIIGGVVFALRPHSGRQVKRAAPADDTTGGTAAGNRDGRWVQLFNGKDLSGWGGSGKGKGSWAVKDGLLVCEPARGGAYLFSDRDDFDDFHLRVEAMVNDVGDSGVFFRAEPGPGTPQGYEVRINCTAADPDRSGSLWKRLPLDNQKLQSVREALVQPNTWFTQEVIADGNHLTVRIDGQPVVDRPDPDFSFTAGCFALGPTSRETALKIRRIEVRDLHPPGSINLLAKAPAPGDQVGQGRWEFERNALTSAGGRGPSRLEIGRAPRSEYVLTLVAERVQGNNTLAIGLPAAGARAVAILDAWDGPRRVSGLEAVDRKIVRDNPTAKWGQLFRGGRPHRIVCTVRRDRLEMTFDGQRVFRFEGDLSRLSVPQWWATPRDDHLFLGTDNCSYRFTKIRLDPIDR